jgi:serine/threonine protein kinase
MEYCTRGDLFDYLSSSGALPASVANGVFCQVMAAVDCLHSNLEVAHLDLKLENVLLCEDFTVKLCDLGFSENVYDRVFKRAGTDGYKAPEIDSTEGYYGVKADIFALGVMLFTLHFGVPPFTSCEDRLYKLLSFRSNASEPKVSLRFFLKGHPSTKDVDSDHLDYQLLSLIQSLVQQDPADRPASIAEVMSHAYFKGSLSKQEVAGVLAKLS